MAKKVNLLNQSFGTYFEIEGRPVTVSEQMKVQDAETIASMYPGVYVEVVEVEDKPAKPATTAKAE